MATPKKMKVVDYLLTFKPTTTTTTMVPRQIIRIGNTLFVHTGEHLLAQDYVLYGKTIQMGMNFSPSYSWNTIPPHPMQMPVSIFAQYEAGPIGPAIEIETELAAFNLFFNEKMFELILTNTNDEINIAHHYKWPRPNCVYDLSMNELKAYIGLLYLSAAKKHTYLSPSYLWDACDNDIYKVIMTQERFEYLTQCLRFDNFITREVRRERDSFSLIREIFDCFFTNSAEVFRPSTNCTVGDTFVHFNGKCKFKLPIPKQPKEHGIQIILLSDSENRYVISGIPYLDKNNNGETPLAEFLVETLTKPIHGTHINVTYSNDLFMSIPLAKRMLNLYKLTTIAPFHKNHVENPPDIISPRNRPVGSFITVYNTEDGLQLCTYCPIDGIVTALLSSKYMPTDPECKPKVVDYYNSTKDSVNKINAICSAHSCSRPVNHWFVAVFFKILDLAAINSQTIVNLNRMKSGKKFVGRAEFLHKLALDLMLPYMMERLTDKDTDDLVKDKIKNIIDERSKLNVELVPSECQLQTMKPSIQNDNSAANIADKSTKIESQQVKNMPSFIPCSKPIQSIQYHVTTELNTQHVVLMKEIQEKYSSVDDEKKNMANTLSSYMKTEMDRISMYIRQMLPILKNSEINLTRNWRQIQTLNPPNQNVVHILPSSNMRAVQPVQPFYQPIGNNTIACGQHFEEDFRNAIMHQIEKFNTLMEPNIPHNTAVQTSQNITVNINQYVTTVDSQVPPENSISDFQRQIVACGICNNVNGQNNFEQCSKCTVVVCAIHWQILCTNCIQSQPLTFNFYEKFLENFKCEVCLKFLENLLLNMCFRCSKFLCSQHRHIICCFCSDA